jgi:hypothetical protein
MSKRNVQSLLSKVIAESDKKSPESAKIRRLINKSTHYYDLDIDNLIYEVSEQVRGTFGKKGIDLVNINSQQQEIINKACKNYFNSVRTTMTVSTKTFKVTVLQNSDSYFSVKIQSAKVNDNFETFLNANRKTPLEELRRYLKENLQPTYTQDVGDRFSRLLDPGHKQGYSIAEHRIRRYLKSFEAKVQNFKKKLPPGVNYEETPMYRLEMAISANDRIDHIKQTIRVTDVFVTEQGRGSNYIQSIEEAKMISSIRKNLREALAKEDWANFAASTAPIDRMSNALLNITQKKLKAKVSGGTRKNKMPAKTPTAVEIKGKARNTSSSERIANVSAQVDESKTNEKNKNWSSLLSILNNRLPLKVAENMKFPALVNRTGEFAASAKVMAVETTKEGYPSFTFDYERDPYNVFDRSVGRAPWNTPERDPRALVDKSLRELLREMAIGRFYTRRA